MASNDWVDDPTFNLPEDDDWVDDKNFSPEKGGQAGLTFLDGFGNSALLGYGAQAKAAIEKPLFGALNAITGNDVEADDFIKARDGYAKSSADLAADNPEAALAGSVTGALSTALIPGLNVAKGATMTARALNAAKTGALIGGLTNPGDTEGEVSMLQPIERLKNAGIGAALGGSLGYAGEKVPALLQSGLSKVGNSSGEVAERMAARSLGAERGTIKKLGQGKVQDIGRYALDEGLLSPLASTDDVIARNLAKQSEGAAKMNEVYSAIDDAGASTFNPLDVAGKVDEQIGGFYRSPINRGETNQLENTLESILMRGEKNIPLTEAQALKRELGKVANWKNNLNITDKERMAREAYGVVSSAIDDAAEAGSAAIGKDGLEQVLAQGKSLYSKSKGAEDLLKNKLAREQGNNFFGLTDTIAGTGAVGAMGPSGLGVLAGKKGLERYGTQNLALGLDKISKALMKSPEMSQVYKNNPQVFQALVRQLESKSGMLQESLPKAAEKQDGALIDNKKILERVKGSKYSGVLEQAAAKGGQSLAAAHFVLSSRDPEYKKTMGED